MKYLGEKDPASAAILQMLAAAKKFAGAALGIEALLAFRLFGAETLYQSKSVDCATLPKRVSCSSLALSYLTENTQHRRNKDQWVNVQGIIHVYCEKPTIYTQAEKRTVLMLFYLRLMLEGQTTQR
jgi:hypothetical protein